MPEAERPFFKSLQKRVQFNEKLEHLVDEEGVKYEGRRFGTVSAASELGGTFSYQRAEQEALYKLEELARTRGAEAYEISSIQLLDSRQEYDATPYTATATALLYKNS